MLGPTLRPRIEQGDRCVCFGIKGMSTIRFMPVAQRTAQPQVIFIIGAAFGPGQDVFYLQSGHD
jgi:hypothetical protein